MKTKSVLCHWLRFEKQCPFVATEAGFFNSDVLAIDKKNKLTEFEIKVSWSDFLADFKKPKHELFLGGSPHSLMGHYETINGKTEKYPEKRILQRYLEFIPSKFYFVVTSAMKDSVLNHIEKYGYPYGVYVVEEGVFELTKRARVIHENGVTIRVKDVIALRMSSEIATLRDRLTAERKQNHWLMNQNSILEGLVEKQEGATNE